MGLDLNKIEEVSKVINFTLACKIRFAGEEIFMSENTEMLKPLSTSELCRLKLYKYIQLRKDVLKSAFLTGLIDEYSYDIQLKKNDDIKVLLEKG